MRPRSLSVLALAVVLGCDSPSVPLRTDTYAFRIVDSELVFHWPIDRIPVRYYAEPVGAIPEFVQAGIDLWESQFLYGEFRGRVVQDSSAADVIVLLDGDAPPTGELTDDPPVSTCSGETRVPAIVGEEGALQLSDKLRVTLQWFPHMDAAAIANCLARVTAHELGHTLGLFAADHAGTETTDLMFSPPSVRRASERDRATVEILYHLPADIRPAERTSP